MIATANSSACSACRDGIGQPFPFSMAFQPIVDIRTGRVFAYEALVRGPPGESAGWILGQVTDQNRYELTRDIHLRPRSRTVVTAMVELARDLGCLLIAEGIECMEEFSALCEAGVYLMQGYLFAKPAFEALPPVSVPVLPGWSASLRLFDSRRSSLL